MFAQKGVEMTEKRRLNFIGFLPFVLLSLISPPFGAIIVACAGIIIAFILFRKKGSKWDISKKLFWSQVITSLSLLLPLSLLYSILKIIEFLSGFTLISLDSIIVILLITPLISLIFAFRLLQKIWKYDKQ